MEDLVIERLLSSDEEEIPVIISGKDCSCEDLEEYIRQVGGKTKHILPIINAVAVYMPPTNIKSMAMEKFTEKIYLDDYVYKLMDICPITVASDFANEYGLTGKNVSVAVLDTGVFPHEDLATPYNRIVAFKDFIGGKTRPYDDDGHGSHVAGIIAGNGFSSKGKYMGIAPDAKIVGVKVLKGDGAGNISDVIAGIQWIVDNRERYNIKVATLSLGTRATSSCSDDPLCKAVNAAVASGITVVVAAGNSGPNPSTITSPAISPHVITVGACNDRNAISHKDISLADFSSIGPTIEGLDKPDILAPGVRITSLANKSLEYDTLSGTSMAAPVVAGCAALLYEKNPQATPGQIKDLIKSKATNLGLNSNRQGSGLLDIKRIVESYEGDFEEGTEKPGRDKPTGPSANNNALAGLISDKTFLIIILVIIILLL